MNEKDKKMIDKAAKDLVEWVRADEKRAIFSIITDGKQMKQIVEGEGLTLADALITMMKDIPQVRMLLSMAVAGYVKTQKPHDNENKHSRDN